MMMDFDTLSKDDFDACKRRFSQLLREMHRVDPLDNASYGALAEGILFASTPDYLRHFLSTWPPERRKLIGFEKVLPLAGTDPDLLEVFTRICQKQF
jgi:hypothetical protein